MADETQTESEARLDSEELDAQSMADQEWEDLRLEAERLAREKEAARKAMEAMVLAQQEESKLPLTLPSKTYMGPTISDQQFNALPEGARIMPPPPAPMAPEQQQMAMQQRVAQGLSVLPPAEADQASLTRLQATDQPGSRTIGVRSFQPGPTSADPTEQQFFAREQMNQAMARGMRPEEAMAMYGQSLFASQRGNRASLRRDVPTPFQLAQMDKWKKPATLTPIQAEQIARWKRQDELAANKPTAEQKESAQIEKTIALKNIDDARREINRLKAELESDDFKAGSNDYRRQQNEIRWAEEKLRQLEESATGRTKVEAPISPPVSGKPKVVSVTRRQ